ncbi:MAG: DUF2726 domain-containing protein [Burkholderiaceae bacterium]|nr:DUF2726 domain-containing protein [Burkholderiaceae bacterium]
MSIEILALLALLGAAVAGYVLYKKHSSPATTADNPATREREDLDTVAAWPPEVTRLLSGGERAAHESLVKALPECIIFSQVPLARFIRVPRRHSYAEWLTRVGHLSVDFLICDRASLVIGAVSLHAMQESERAARRRARMSRVLKAAGIKVFVWREQSIPTPESAREQIIQRTGAIDPTLPPITIGTPKTLKPAHTATGNGKLPVPEVLAVAPDDGPRREPPSSTWFDDLDSGPTPLDPARKRPNP